MILFLLNHPAHSQGHKGFEAYYYPVNNGLWPALSTKVYYQAKSNWYGELRYNYEEEKTMSCSVGKTFFREKAFSYSFTPQVGLVAGRSQGITLGLNATAGYKRFFFSSMVQHASCFEKGEENFLFSWSELGYKVTNHIYAGLVLQQTRSYPEANRWEPGLEAGLSFGGWTVPFFLFNPLGNQRYFMAGICHDWKN